MAEARTEARRADADAPIDEDSAVVAFQLGREPRSPWRTAVRCRFGHPAVLACPGRLCDGTPFPTLYWLSCPSRVAAVGALESAGQGDAWERRLTAEPDLARRALSFDESYRAARAAESGGADPCAAAGVAGEREPLRVKCLHARVAAHMAGLDDPIAAAIADGVNDCENDECGRRGHGATLPHAAPVRGAGG